MQSVKSSGKNDQFTRSTSSSWTLLDPFGTARAFVTYFFVPGIPVLLMYGTTFHGCYFSCTQRIPFPSDSLSALKSWSWTFSECLSNSFAKWSLVQPPGPFTCIYGYQITNATMLAFQWPSEVHRSPYTLNKQASLATFSFVSVASFCQAKIAAIIQRKHPFLSQL